MTHLGPEIAALVDGELGHDARDRALAHLARCADCRAAVDAERRTKAMLRAAPPVPSPADLVQRLTRLPAELSAPGAPPGDPGAPWRSRRRRARRDSTAPRDRRPSRTPRRRRRLSMAGAVAVLGAGIAAFAVGGGPADGRSITPQVDRFGVEHAMVAPEVPLEDEGGPAVVVSFTRPTAP